MTIRDEAQKLRQKAIKRTLELKAQGLNYKEIETVFKKENMHEHRSNGVPFHHGTIRGWLHLPRHAKNRANARRSLAGKPDTTQTTTTPKVTPQGFEKVVLDIMCLDIPDALKAKFIGEVVR